MNILFIYSIDDILRPDKPLRTSAQMQFGISYISSVLKEAGHSTRLLVLSRLLGRNNRAVIDRHIKEFNPRMACFTAVSTEYPFIKSVARHIREKYPGIFLLIGGPHVSLNPEGVLEDGFDALCIGEGEYPAREIAEQIEKCKEPSGIANLWIKKDNMVEKNAPRHFHRDIDALPLPDRDMWKEWVGGAGGEEPILLGRGCPFECTYCCNHALKKVAPGQYVRFRLTGDILREIKSVAAKYPVVKDFYLEVETIGADMAWALDLCGKLAEFNYSLKKPLAFGVNLRIAPNLDYDALFSAFEKSNFKSVNIGVESGSDRVRREILNRHYSNKDIADVVRLARKHKLKVNFYNLIGVPGETAEDFRETIKINRECLPDKAYAHIFYPYPGTRLYDVCSEKRLLPGSADTKLERCTAVLDLPGFSKKQIRNGFIWFDYDVYKGKRPMHRILAGVLVSKCRSNPILHRIYRKFTYSALCQCMRTALGRTA